MASMLGHDMANAVWWLTFGSILQLIIVVQCHPAKEWDSHCPTVCSCHLSHFADLPLNYWIEDDARNSSFTTNLNNQAFYEEDTQTGMPGMSDRGELLKMAMCVFQKGVNSAELLYQLPSDIQVLSLLQSKDSGEIILDAHQMQHFRRLFYLDVQGYGHKLNRGRDDDILQASNLLLTNDVFQPLTSLKFLNLQHVKLLSNSMETNKIDKLPQQNTYVDPFSNELSILLQDRNTAIHKEPKNKGKAKNLIFLTPTEPENEILPYKTYLEEKEHPGFSTFAGLSNLVFLRVFSCNLHEVNWEMFEGLDKLQYLSLEQNHLLFIPEFAFYGTPNLKTLLLSHNNLLNLQSTGLAGLLELEKLDLSHNKFSHLSEFSLPPFPKLRIANFRHNPIEAVFASTFEIMNATTTLYLGGNGSTLDIHPNSFLGLMSLEKLSIYNIGTELLERQLLSGMPKLKELEMFGTITALSFDAFLEVPELEKLVLTECKIQSISMDAFYGLYGLLHLDLSNNMLQVLPPGLFDQQFLLRELLLQNNLLKELPTGFFKTIPAKMVRLEGNPWHCSCNMKDWQPTVINKVKQTKPVLCQTEYDKGSMCNRKPEEQYVYEKKVAPRCATPNKYKGWSVFQVTRKELRCTKKLRNKLHRKDYLRKKYEDYERSLKASHSHDQKAKDMPENAEDVTKHNRGVLTLETKIKIIPPVQTPNNDNVLHKSSEKKEINIQQPYTPPTAIPKWNMSTINTSDLPTNSMNEIQNNLGSEMNYINNNIIESQLAESRTSAKSHKISDINDIQQQIHLPYNEEMVTLNRQGDKSDKGFHLETKPDRQKLEKNPALRDKQGTLPVKEEPKALKKAWKLEMERKHREKLQKYTN